MITDVLSIFVARSRDEVNFLAPLRGKRRSCSIPKRGTSGPRRNLCVPHKVALLDIDIHASRLPSVPRIGVKKYHRSHHTWKMVVNFAPG